MSDLDPKAALAYSNKAAQRIETEKGAVYVARLKSSERTLLTLGLMGSLEERALAPYRAMAASIRNADGKPAFTFEEICDLDSEYTDAMFKAFKQVNSDIFGGDDSGNG